MEETESTREGPGNDSHTAQSASTRDLDELPISDVSDMNEMLEDSSLPKGQADGTKSCPSNVTAATHPQPTGPSGTLSSLSEIFTADH